MNHYIRINKGCLKGSRISVPPHIRPTMSYVRDAIFNMLFDFITNKNVLDLFAGSGAFGIQALSLSAKHVVFVDSNNLVTKHLYSNLHLIQKTHDYNFSYKIINNDFTHYLKTCTQSFDIIFCDPPYSYTDATKLKPIIHNILSSKVPHSNGKIILEIPTKTLKSSTFPLIIAPYNNQLYKTKIYGSTAICFFHSCANMSS